MPTLPQLASLWIAILLSCACEEGKSPSHSKYVQACKADCQEASGRTGANKPARGGISDPPAGSADDDGREPSFDEPFTGIAGSGGIFGGTAGAGGFAGFPQPGDGAGVGGDGEPIGGFGPVGGFGNP